MGRMIDLNKFSESQQEAITTNDKHLRIIACAGSGKTTTVAGKVAYLLDPLNQFDIKPENIIAFTYTEKAAGELKNKILNNVGQYRGMANMYIGTIHRSEEHTSELQSRENLVCRLLLEKKKITAAE